MTRFTILATCLAFVVIVGQAHAFLGPAPTGTAIADYNPATGEISVSINGVNNWFIRSASLGLTGDIPSFAPIIPGSISSDSNELIGETALAVATGSNVSLGNVAATGLPLSDLSISWNAGLGVSVETQPVSLWVDLPPTNFPPEARINGPFLANTLSGPLDILLDAGSSIDNSPNDPLSYRWDLDNNGIFEVNTGTTATLAIADVLSTFGGVGTYPVAVEVFDGEFMNVASSTLEIVSQPRLVGPGPAPAGTVIAQYDPITGQIVVSASGVSQWVVFDENELVMTGDAPMGLTGSGLFVTDNNFQIGQESSSQLTFTNLDLGYVAKTGLADDGTLVVVRNLASPHSVSQPISFVTIASVPEPTSLAFAALGLLALGYQRRKRA